ncbi:GNAT family N-acetyltransferase [Streptomyces sp. NPDC059080]|uniref:GNAT family N-acetyltransferase n=1 Tax=Streptomyces sp. NPDC059080 TaxID=3346718 RepID=UPI00369CFB22
MYPVSRCSSRVALRELAVRDVGAVYAIYGSSEATEHLSFEPRSLEQTSGIVARSIASAANSPRDEYALAVVERFSNELIGFTRLANDPHQQRAATFGIALNPNYWGAHYGLDAVRLLFDFGFDSLGLHRIWGARSPVNAASAHMMATIGMTEEGRIREHIFKSGKWRDSIVHGILDSEWSGASGGS